ASARCYLRPAGFAEPGAVEEFVRDLGAGDPATEGLLREVRRVEVRYGGLVRTAARAADTPVPVGGYEANPLLSVPDLVDKAAGELGTDPDVAALYLQLLTLARPTNANVRRWNGWSASRHL